MKKIKLVALTLTAALCLGGAACKKAVADEAPVIAGIADKICAVGEIYDLLNGVTALDKEDGDITPALKITVNGDEVEGFYTRFEYEDDYSVTYTVTDSKGHTAEETATVSAVARDVYKSFEPVNLAGFEVRTAGAAKCSQSVISKDDASVYTLKITGAHADADAVLSRKYTLTCGAVYTFEYYLKSDVAGTVKAKIGNGDAAELTVAEGDNTLTFNYSVPAGDNEITADVQLLLGGLGDAQVDLVKAEARHDGILVKEVKFKAGDNVKDRFDGAGGEFTCQQDGTSATLVINTPAADLWRGGMFINTGVKLVAGISYKISYDLTANSAGFGVVLQNKQWGESRYDYVTIATSADYHQENTVTPATDDGLWLYIEAGNAVNEITISNLTITGQSDQSITETFACSSTFKMFAYEGAPCYVQWVDGKLIFEVEHFSDTDWHNKIEGPQFYIDTAGVEFMISFKARATAPVLVTWVGPKSGGWDPNLIWRQFNLSDEEMVYTFKGNESDTSNHQFEWQFGFSVNKKYENVKIEISDIVIYWQNAVLDN